MALLSYIKETRNEMSHVQWPTVRKTVIFTVLVALFTLCMAYILGAVDFGLLKGLGLLAQIVK